MKITRSLVMDALLVIALLLTVPPGLYRFWVTGDPYLFTPQFWADLVARFHGPGKLRFIFQPVMAVLLGAGGGINDARAGLPPFLWTMVFRARDRRQAWHSALAATRDLVALAILLDLIAQALILHQVYPGASLIVGPILIAVPYCLARALANLFVRHRNQRHDFRAAA
jgi:hypothetical protein